LLPSDTVGMAVGEEAVAAQAESNNAIITIIKSLLASSAFRAVQCILMFFILSYDFPLALLSFVMTPSCKVTTRSA
jgi:hypothetical protein